MSKEAVFTMKLEPELRADFMAEVAGEDRPASQVMRELMRGYIEQRRRPANTTNTCGARSKPAAPRCVPAVAGRMMKWKPRSLPGATR
jgi:hypothetical protein